MCWSTMVMEKVGGIIKCRSGNKGGSHTRRQLQAEMGAEDDLGLCMTSRGANQLQ